MTSPRALTARVLAVLALAAVLTACGGSDEPTASGASAPPTSSTATDLPTAASPTDTAPAEVTPSEPTFSVSPVTPTPKPSPDVPPPTAPSVVAGPDTTEADRAAGEDWVDALDELVDSSIPTRLRAAHIQGGADLVDALEGLDQQLAGVDLRFVVSEPVVEGSEGSGGVVITADGESAGFADGVGFVLVDSTWRLTRAGACTLAAASGLTCP